MYVKWNDASAFDEGENPYAVGGASDEVYGTVVGFVVIREETHAVIRPKHNDVFINLPLSKIKEVER